MSMMMTLTALSQETLWELLRNPRSTNELITDPADDAEMEKCGIAIERKLRGRPQAECHLAQSWHLIHYTLTRDVWEGNWPANFLMAGQVIGEDLGYGQARIFNLSEVSEFRNFLDESDFPAKLRELTVGDLVEKQIYPVFAKEPIEQIKALAQSGFDCLAPFVRRSTENGWSIMISLT